MEKNKLGSSFNKQEEILNFLKSDSPEVFSEGKIDCKKLKQTLGEEVDDSNERYGLSWAGKSGCFQIIQEQTTATLKPAKGESVDFDKTQNLFIEGDNLEVLKVLQRSYYGKVKMIYIDPPYNTGSDFIYNDKFQQDKNEYLEAVGNSDSNGNALRVDGLSRNTKDSGHYHSNWLNMMYPRLFLARNLLSQDGVIFVSIDDNEVKNLRMIMDEVFGEENFVGCIPILSNPRGRQSSKFIAQTHEYILIFCKSTEFLMFNGLELTEEQKGEYNKKDETGCYREMGLRLRGGRATAIESPTLHFSIYYNIGKDEFYTERKHEDDYEIIPKFEDGTLGTWRWGKGKINKDKKYLVVHKVKDRYDVFQKDYLTNDKTMKIKSLWVEKEINYDRSADELKELFDNKNPFDYAKPIYLIKKILKIGTRSNEENICLDFFSGSGTTAHAVMQQNAEDGGNRKWICVQLPELCDEESEAYKAGYKTIAEIGKERIRRAGKRIEEQVSEKRGYLNGLKDVYGHKKGEIKEVQSEMESPAYDFDYGFKVLKLDKSNFKIWQGKFENTENLLNAMAEFVDNVQKGSKEENILFELILKSGLDLNVPIKEKNFGGDKCYSLDGGKLIVYLGKKITKEMTEEIQKAKPEKFICLDGCFQNNDQLKTNISLQMEQEKIDFKVI